MAHDPDVKGPNVKDPGVNGGGPALAPDLDSDEDVPTRDYESKSEGGAPQRPALLLAEFDSPGACLHAAEKLREAGYRRFDAHTPFPVHGMDQAMGLPDSRLGWLVLVMGLTGCSAGFLMMWWMNGVDYPIVIGGKPPYSLPSMIPIMFELTVLFSAIGAVFGMFHLNRIPQHHHAIFESQRFQAFSDNKFFISVEADDPKFDVGTTKSFLLSLNPAAVELVKEPV